MTLLYELHKKYIYKYKETHRDKWNEYYRNYNKLNYDDEAKKKKRNYYLLKKEFRRLCDISI